MPKFCHLNTKKNGTVTAEQLGEILEVMAREIAEIVTDLNRKIESATAQVEELNRHLETERRLRLSGHKRR